MQPFEGSLCRSAVFALGCSLVAAQSVTGTLNPWQSQRDSQQPELRTNTFGWGPRLVQAGLKYTF
jgi:hypothetical protein